MHRSGTSSITRAVNLLGFFLGADEKMMPPTADNAEGYWEHLEIVALQERLLAQLNYRWDAAHPLPKHWHLHPAIRPLRGELKELIVKNFSSASMWAWKDPRSCLLMPLWRDVLEELRMELNCIFVVRNPIDVGNSLAKRDRIPRDKAQGVWLNYCLTALKDTVGVPTVFVNYDRFLASWETEMRRCADGLNIRWPSDEATLHATMHTFLRPELRRNRSTAEDLKKLPHAVRALYDLLLGSTAKPDARDAHFENTIGRLSEEFRSYAMFFEHDMRRLFDLDKPEHQSPQIKPPFLPRTTRRWKHSVRKRLLRWSRPQKSEPLA